MKAKTAVLLGLLLLKFLLHYLLLGNDYELHRDEFLHLDQGRHPAWGYISVPPLTSWVSQLIYLLGNGFFWVKFFPALFGALTLVLVWKTVALLKGGLVACTLAGLAVLLSCILRINILYQPNSSDIFFWTLLYYLLLRYLHAGAPRWLYAFGAAAGFALLSKYNVAFLFAALAPALLLTPQRRLLANRHFYGAIALAFLVVLPNLIWQYQNNFPTYHQLKELQSRQLTHVNRIDFLKEQVLYFANSFFLIVLALVAMLRYPPFKPYRIIGLSYLVAMALFVWLQAKSYYAIGLYPVLIAFGAVYFEAISAKGRRRLWRAAAFTALVLLFLPLLIAFPLQSPEAIARNPKRYEQFGMLRWEDGKNHQLPQDLADMLGWKELAFKTDSLYAALPNKETVLVLCDNYGQAGAINYYSRFKTIDAVSFNADYINWMPLHRKLQTVLLVKEKGDSAGARERQLFAQVHQAGVVTHPFAREAGTAIYLLQQPKTNINAVLASEIKRRKPAP